jgi:MFS family permease
MSSINNISSSDDEKVDNAYDSKSRGTEAHILEPDSPTTDIPNPNQLDDQTQRLPFPRLMAAYLCLCLCYFISYLDMNSLTTSIQVISEALNTGPSITWVGTAYLLGQTSCQPLYGRISDIVGRKPVLLFSVGCIVVGGLLCGFAKTPTWLYVCRAISGIGGGGISSSVAIIVSDLVSLRSRGKYQGMISLAIGVGAAVGPFVAAALISTGPNGWRWAFRVPSFAAAGCFCLLTFLLPQKPVLGDWRVKVRKVDWIGVVTSVAGIVLLLVSASVLSKQQYRFNSEVPRCLSIQGGAFGPGIVPKLFQHSLWASFCSSLLL